MSSKRLSCIKFTTPSFANSRLAEKTEASPVFLKLIEDEWLNNDFKISNKRVLEIIKAQNR